MVPIVLNAETVSGITGSISIACWVIVFVPQIYENYYRSSSEGLSLTFIVLWLLGDVFNVLGGVLQGVLPTTIALAVYYTVADIVLLVQCLIYGSGSKGEPVDPVHLSPANPLSENVLSDVFHEHTKTGERQPLLQTGPVQEQPEDFMVYLKRTLMVCGVLLTGFAGWYVTYLNQDGSPEPLDPSTIEINFMAQVFGYLCAVLYLGSRVPQILLNFKRKSCDGISIMFFLFACLGNTTFVVSVLSISVHPHYLLANSSWLIGSIGTLVLDFIIFIQFFVYNGPEEANRV